MKICMLAAENGAIPGAKVGGLGDVLRDIPRALADLGHEVDVIMPGYRHFAGAAGAEAQAPLKLRFRRETPRVEVSRLELAGGVRCWLLDHPLFAVGGAGRIYCDDPPGRPFATDASKFALFGAAACQLLVEGRLGSVDVIHLHDWHAAFAALLIRFDPRFRPLGDARLVFTIHNLAMQGIRPFAEDVSSLEEWFPELKYQKKAVADPRYPDCFNPLRAAVNLCDRAHTVSPTYADEIRRSNRPEIGFHGGEGLERDLQQAHRAGRLSGILNGCEYGESASASPSANERIAVSSSRESSSEPIKPAGPSPNEFIAAARQQVFHWIGDGTHVDSSHCIALERLASWRDRPPAHWVTSISRLTPQKTALFQVAMKDGKSCLENLLAALPRDHVFVMLGSGDAEIEGFFTSRAARCENFLFLKGYSELLSHTIYALGSLFLMPSSFEPCGIGQMLAMRAGQPCLAHRVGGLADTIANDVDGFTFAGRDQAHQADAFLRKFKQALSLKRRSPRRWANIRQAAAARRFSWKDSARQYCEQLYGHDGTIG